MRSVTFSWRPVLNQRQFSTNPAQQKLSAALHPQEWTTASYHYNKATSKLLPLAANKTDRLLQQYITAVPKNTVRSKDGKIDTSRMRAALDKAYITDCNVKDYGHKVVVEAFYFDGAKYANATRRN